eukprot:3385218-Pleurochrysis_carterae.AAC.7
MRVQGRLFMLGYIMGHTRRYPGSELDELCGVEPGDWYVMSSKLDRGHNIWAVGHRSGSEVHTLHHDVRHYTPGKPKLHTEEQADGMGGQACPCPWVLNNWTKMQPAIADASRHPQKIFAFEYRFVTSSFPFCLLTTVLGMVYFNAYNLHKYFNCKSAAGGTVEETAKQMAEASVGDGLRAFMRSCANDAMHST